ncbi:unnamed protein product [Gongylonema pulchrum]|uniref:SH3 domain-containing protein n=1 Tax=Gongylonema pulchrum TaxID=637853 RepID=A0A183EVS4_9BILA|nr:unnamed protein product [Gongylonema pulchrum]
MIIGPPRAQDRNTVAGEGVFLSISQPLVASEPARKRKIRQAPLTIFGVRNWPAEFGHLRLRKGDRVPVINRQQKDPFAGIEMDTEASLEDTAKTREIHIGDAAEPEPATLDSPTSTTMFVFICQNVCFLVDGVGSVNSVF